MSNNFPFRGRLRHGEPKVSNYASKVSKTIIIHKFKAENFVDLTVILIVRLSVLITKKCVNSI